MKKKDWIAIAKAVYGAAKKITNIGRDGSRLRMRILATHMRVLQVSPL